MNNTTADKTASALAAMGASRIPTDTFLKVVEINRQTVAYCKRELETAVLDGTPFLLVITVEGCDRVFGHWPDLNTGKTTSGFIGFYAVPDHLCGTMLYGQATGEAACRAMNAQGDYKARLMHRRDFTRSRLELAEATIKQCEAYLATLN